MTDFPERFRKLRIVWLGTDGGPASEARIEKAVVSPRGIRVKLKGIDDRDVAGRLRGKILFVDEAHRAKLPEGEYFVHDVLGLRYGRKAAPISARWPMSSATRPAMSTLCGETGGRYSSPR